MDWLLLIDFPPEKTHVSVELDLLLLLDLHDLVVDLGLWETQG